MKIISKDINTISQHKYLRADCKYWNTINEIQFSKYYLLKDLFEVISGSVQTTNYTNETTSIPYIRIGDIDYKFGIQNKDITYLVDDAEISEQRILRKGDLVLATIGATVGKVGLADAVVGGTHSNNTIVLRPKKQYNMKFYERLLQTDLFIKYIFGVVSQKAQPNLQLYDIENIQIPIIEENTITAIMEESIGIEKEINKIKAKQKNVLEIIDTVLKDVFSFHYEKFNELKKISFYQTNESIYSNNPDLRFSAKFHRPAGEYVENELRRIGKKRFKHYLAEPIVLGASIAPTDCCEDGEFCYISMATIKTWEFDKDSANIVSNDYAEAKNEKRVKKNDIILARSGEGTIGKVALIEEDVNAIFCDFTMRIRLKNYNPKFAYYYMRSTYFQYLVEIYKKGLGNNTNIFPIVVQEFPLPDLSLDEQQKIVDAIQLEIDKQNDIKNQIASLRGKIDSIIENAIISND